MAENLVAKSTEKRLGMLETSIAAIALALGIDMDATTASADKTTARVTQTHDAPAMARKAKADIEPVSVVLTQAMIEGRMKLPSRMFTKGTKVEIDGHVFTQQPNDQNRSTKFDPAIFGYDVAVGDTITFEHVSGREWEVTEVEDGGGKPPRKAKANAKASAKPAKSQKSAKPAAGRVARNEGQTQSLAKEFQKFADMAIENASTKGFKKNANIAENTKYDPDARVYLSTPESQKFRAMWKRHGLKLSTAVGKLNALVFDEA